MSLNKAHAGGVSAVVVFNGERILIFYDGCQFTLKPTNGNIAHFQGKKNGRVYLTTHRVIFINSKSSDLLQSFSMPFSRITNLDIKQPIFGANSVVGNVSAEEGWEGSASFSLTFNHGGAIEFGRALLEAGRRASQNRFQPPPISICIGPFPDYYAAPPPAYTPPYADPYYGQFVPQHEAFGMPPNGAIYVMPAPPPYPGAGPAPPYFPPNQPPPGQQNQAASYSSPAEAKAAEAAAVSATTGYYNNSADPHTVYADAPPPYAAASAPPAYDYASKKSD